MLKLVLYVCRMTNISINGALCVVNSKVDANWVFAQTCGTPYPQRKVEHAGAVDGCTRPFQLLGHLIHQRLLRCTRHKSRCE